MVLEARAGQCVVRFKGGDTYLCGRGGEERVHLQAQGVTVEVVAWITSGLAVAASAGIAVTHRQHSQGVIFVTCHNKQDSAQPNWQALADANMTLVIYMGIRALSPIAEKFIGRRHGRSDAGRGNSVSNVVGACTFADHIGAPVLGFARQRPRQSQHHRHWRSSA